MLEAPRTRIYIVLKIGSSSMFASALLNICAINSQRVGSFDFDIANINPLLMKTVCAIHNKQKELQASMAHKLNNVNFHWNRKFCSRKYEKLLFMPPKLHKKFMRSLYMDYFKDFLERTIS